MVRLGRSDNAIAQLQAAGFSVAATTVRGGQSLYGIRLPDRLVLLMGAEQSGVDAALAQASTIRLLIPGSGAVESLNVASATSVLLSEWCRQQRSA
jgi:TrmH RNA methyltransferase